MAKTRRQRALEHPGMPKKGVRDQRRVVKEKSPEDIEAAKQAAQVMGRIGGAAEHVTRGLETATKEKRREVAMAGVKARRELGLLPKEKLAKKEKKDAERKGNQCEVT